MSEIEESVIVIFTGDETVARKKNGGRTIMEQMFASVESIRNNWSREIEILFIHTEPLSDTSLRYLDQLDVGNINAGRKVNPSFPIANKMLIGETYKGEKDILFLDCDTLVHKSLDFDISQDALVAYDALQDVTEEQYRRLYDTVGVDFPSGAFSDRPSYEYYYNDRNDMFPLINTGVYFLRNKFRDDFYTKLQENFHLTYGIFRDELTFYFDQICFAMTLRQLGIHYKFFPKGYNFICTSRAPYLMHWPKDQILIEHYAGNNSKPLVFNGNRIDLAKSEISIDHL